jgi:hypothetical protein
MRITTFARTFLLLVALVFLSACASNVTKTNQLAPGMTAAQVKESMGEPSQTQFISNKWVWKYSLHQPWVGFIPYYLVFDKDTQTLQQWYADQAEYQANQSLWIKAAASMPTYSPPPAPAPVQPVQVQIRQPEPKSTTTNCRPMGHGTISCVTQ